MAILFGVGNIIKGHLKPVSLMQNNIKSLKEYKALEGNFTYKLPSEWVTGIQSFPGNQIIYHNDFVADDLLTSGFVQVWREQDDLKEFLDRSREVAEEQNKVQGYKIKNIKIKDREAYSIKYIITSKEVAYIAHEYFIKYNKGFVRFAFFSRYDNFNEDKTALYDSILETISLQ
jgi:hypothetical protein